MRNRIISVIVILTMLAVFIPVLVSQSATATTEPTPPPSSPQLSCVLEGVVGSVAQVRCVDENGNTIKVISVPVPGGPTISVPGPTTFVTLPPVTLPPVQLPGATVTLPPIKLPGTEATVTDTVTITKEPAPRPTVFITERPEPISRFVFGPTRTVTATKTVTATAETTVTASPSPSPTLFATENVEPSRQPTETSGTVETADPITRIIDSPGKVIGISTLTILILVGLMVLGSWFGYMLGYKDSDRANASFMAALSDKMIIRNR